MLKDPLSAQDNIEFEAQLKQLLHNDSSITNPNKWIALRLDLSNLLHMEHHRYCDDMLRYHYSKDVDIIQQCVVKRVHYLLDGTHICNP